MGKRGSSQPLLRESVVPTAVVTINRFVDRVGNQIAVAGARAFGVSADDHSAEDLAAGRAMPVVTIGIGELEINATVAKGDLLTSDNVGRGVIPTAAQAINAVAREGGVAGDRIGVFVICIGDRVASANIAAPAGGATVDAEARAAINSILAVLDAQGLTL